MTFEYLIDDEDDADTLLDDDADAGIDTNSPDWRDQFAAHCEGYDDESIDALSDDAEDDASGVEALDEGED